jgi:hypothetical protein
MPDVSRAWAAGDAGLVRCRGHVGAQDVVRVPVEVLAGPVVAQRPRISVAGSDLGIPQVHPAPSMVCEGMAEQTAVGSGPERGHKSAP